MRKSVIAGGIASLAIIAGTAAPAFAAGTPVAATATIETTIALSNVSPTVPFSSVLPGTPSTVASAQNYHVMTNSPTGATIQVSPDGAQPAGFRDGGGNFVLSNNAITVNSGTVTSGTPIPLSESAAVITENVPVGNGDYPESWTLSVPGSFSYVGTMATHLTVSAVLNS